MRSRAQRSSHPDRDERLPGTRRCFTSSSWSTSVCQAVDTKTWNKVLRPGVEVDTVLRAAGKLICEAIRKRARLEFRYNGQSRVVEPYCYGVSTKGVEVLRAIQVRGASSSGLGFGKLWSIERMEAVRILDETFTPGDPNYNPDDSAMQQIHCRI